MNALDFALGVCVAIIAFQYVAISFYSKLVAELKERLQKYEDV